MRSTRSLLATLAFAAGSALNPAYITGCGSDDPRFEYGAEELAALAREWSGVHLVRSMQAQRCARDGSCSDDGDYVVELQLMPAQDPQASASGVGWLGGRARACGNRTLFAAASACSDSSSMDLHGRITLTRANGQKVADDGEVKGELSVSGLKLTNASLHLEFEGGSFFAYSLDGKVFDAPELRFYERADAKAR